MAATIIEPSIAGPNSFHINTSEKGARNDLNSAQTGTPILKMTRTQTSRLTHNGASSTRGHEPIAIDSAAEAPDAPRTASRASRVVTTSSGRSVATAAAARAG